MSRENTYGVLLTCVALLTAVSCAVVLKGAQDEPYNVYRQADAFVQIGLGSALIALWASMATAVLFAIRKRKMSAGWLAVPVWAVVCAFYLSTGVAGYLSDIETHILR